MTNPKNNEVGEIILPQDNYKLFFDKTPISIVLIDNKGQLAEVNNATLKIFGFKREDLIGHKFIDLYNVPAGEITRMRKIFSDLFKGGKFGPEDIQIFNKDKNLIWVNTIASKIELNNQSYIQILTQDISQRKSLEKGMKESEEKYRDLADSLPEVIFDIDLAFNISYTNEVASKIFGYSNEEFKDGMSIFHFISPDDKELVLKQTKQIIRGEYIKPLTLRPSITWSFIISSADSGRD